jgi:hypothetical protein
MLVDIKPCLGRYLVVRKATAYCNHTDQAHSRLGMVVLFRCAASEQFRANLMTSSAPLSLLQLVTVFSASLCPHHTWLCLSTGPSPDAAPAAQPKRPCRARYSARRYFSVRRSRALCSLWHPMEVPCHRRRISADLRAVPVQRARLPAAAGGGAAAAGPQRRRCCSPRRSRITSSTRGAAC